MRDQDDWHSRTRSERLASILYRAQTSESTQRQMEKLAKVEAKKLPSQARLLANDVRGSASPLAGRANDGPLSLTRRSLRWKLPQRRAASQPLA